MWQGPGPGSRGLTQGLEGLLGGVSSGPTRVRRLSSAGSWRGPRAGGHQALSRPPAGPCLRPPGLGSLRVPRHTGDTNGQTPSAWQAQSLKEAEGERQGVRSDGPRQAGPHTRCPQALSPCLAPKALKSVTVQSKSLAPEGLKQS